MSWPAAQVTSLFSIGAQTPSKQPQTPLHLSPSSQAVQSLSLSHSQRSVAPRQTPSPQTSSPVQGFKSLHGCVFAVCWQPVAESQLSSVQGLASSHGSTAKVEQVPPMHWNPVQAFHIAWLHEVPSSADVAVQVPAWLQTPRSHSPRASWASSHSAQVGLVTSSQVPPLQAAFWQGPIEPSSSSHCEWYWHSLSGITTSGSGSVVGAPPSSPQPPAISSIVARTRAPGPSRIRFMWVSLAFGSRHLTERPPRRQQGSETQTC